MSAEQAHEPDAPRRLDVFVHVPKSAGTTLTRVIRQNAAVGAHRTRNIFKGTGGDGDPDYGRMVQRIREDQDAVLVAGHVPLGFVDLLPKEWTVRAFTFLRDPVERAISHYFEIVGAEQISPRYDKASGPDAKPIRSISEVSFDEAFTSADFVFDNLQTRMLSGDTHPFNAVDEAMLERALFNLEHRLTVVGLAERFEESLVVLDRRLGYPLVAFTNERVNTSRPRGAAVPDDLRAAAERANATDRVLYDRAVQLFDLLPELGWLDVAIDVAALRGSASASSIDVAPPPAFPGGPDAWSLVLDARISVLEERGAKLRALRRASRLEAQVAGLAEEAQAAREDAARQREKVSVVSAKLGRSRAARVRAGDPGTKKKVRRDTAKEGGESPEH